MSILKEFRRPGGFEDLLTLLEVTDAKKRDVIISRIQIEDAGMASMLKAKMLTSDRMSKWPLEVQASVLIHLDARPLSIILKSKDVKLHELIFAQLKKDLHPRVKAYLAENHTSHELLAAEISLIQTARKLISDGTLNLYQVDPSLALNAV